MQHFKVSFSGDCLDEAGNVRGPDIGIEALSSIKFIQTTFLLDQKPDAADPSYWNRLYSLEVTPEHVANANAIVLVRPWLKAGAFVKGAKDLVVIGRAGAGYDKIDIKSCTRNDVAVFNTPDSLTHSTASAALTLLLALAKRLPQQQEILRSGRWDKQSEMYGDDLIGKTLGIIGLGKTGMELARLASPFYMKVIAYSPHADRFSAEALGVELIPDLNTLLSTSDFVSLHCRLEKHTRGMLDLGKLNLLKPTAYLINVGRGELVDTKALVEILRERRIAGAGLDVFETEPLPLSSPFLALDNVILTPHWLPSTHRAARATREGIVRNLIRAATGQTPDSVINPEVLGRPGFLQKLARFKENRVATDAGALEFR